MSHALLLRLFLSPSFFSVHVALQYLRVYADNIGITYYLTRRLRELDIQELREVWGFICHLLVTKPSKSRALECFVVETAQKSTHIAMMTLWYMQAYLKDLSPPRNKPESFLICRRILHQCHEIIFGDFPGQPHTPYSSLQFPKSLAFTKRKVKPHVEPALVGLGMLLAGTPGVPVLTDIMGNVAIEQGRTDELGQDIKSLEHVDDDDDTVLTVTTDGLASQGDQERESDESYDDDKPVYLDQQALPAKGDFAGTIAARRLGASSRRQTIAAQTSPALPLHLKDIRKPRLSEDPFDQVGGTSAVPAPTPFQSTPTFSSTKPISRTSSLNRADNLLQKYDMASQIHLLRSHYCRSEIRFLLVLENISNRLLVVPKPARVSALRAELTGLNHKLPAEVCMPMWCSSADTPQRPHGIPQPHHRIVRIPPGESVVLNSAERAPYVLLLEILHDDLDFDPTKRSNKDTLRRVLVKENERKEPSSEVLTFISPTSAQRLPTVLIDHVNGSEVALGTDSVELTDEPLTVSSDLIAPLSPTSPTDEEEIDLVEQLYGESNSLRGVDLSESVVLPPAPKNRELDMAAWSRSSSMPQTPVVDNNTVSDQVASLPSSTPVDRQSAARVSSAFQEASAASMSKRVLSLDEYSERMRTAAVMLAQLNANMTRDSIISPSTPDPNSASVPFRWLPGSSWLMGSPSLSTESSTGLSTAPGGTQDSAAAAHPTPSSVPMRMRLQPAEATAIRDRIMAEMLALEEERMARMRETGVDDGVLGISQSSGGLKTAEDEGIIRRELAKADPSAVVFSESWAAKKSRIRQASPYGHLANWDCVSVIVKTGGDLRQEQLAVQLIQEFEKIWREENCACWVRYFRILVMGNNSGLVETITDAVSIHSIKKAEYARRMAEGQLGHVSLLDHFKTTYGDPSSAKFARAQRNFVKSLAGYSLVTYLLQIKDRHNGNILLDRDGHLIHIDFGFMLSNSPGNIGFEAAPFKLPLEYIEVMGGVESPSYREFKRLFREGFEAARKHCDRIITMVELMQKDSTLPCFAALGEQTATQLRERFQQGLTHASVEEHVQRLIDTSLGSNWTRLYDSYQYYSQSIL
ncbi:kinase-like protein [Obba rivulosa]|uniref:1-phosphatidylinositol 4-kinase n=1 Tax=Obba rivulosa TaxID=1052685 RepID=A0A8E2DSV1_9APHY|nr:kinase-like protein [Obba rivulosa]